MPQLIIHEVGPRDGLQVEKQAVPFERKVAWIEGLAATGVDIIQLGSFVHPEKVPQMADTDRLFTHFSAAANRPAGVVFSGLVLNERGLERGLACGVDMFCMGVSASETHSRKNTGMSPGEALARIVPMAKQAQAAGKLVQVSVQSAFGCGFEGPIPRERVLALVQDYLAAGIKAISLADTAGHANPAQVEELLGAIKALDPAVQLTAHFHNTYGLGLANCWAAIKAGARSLEAACGGLGGCPFTKVPAGNVSTEDLVHTLQRTGLRRDIDLQALVEVARDIGRFFDRELPGFILKSGSIVDFGPASPASPALPA
ncbi:MAG: hydroxymethylglutaryl-CoA lyase [Candidatus Krumholzibacteria bacterium]|nr:hydroxymethylglutaryl-CoA lyase [Candidatus Krumholzibacteria bacterium]